MKNSNWGLWDYHLVIQKLSNDPPEKVIEEVRHITKQ